MITKGMTSFVGGALVLASISAWAGEQPKKDIEAVVLKSNVKVVLHPNGKWEYQKPTVGGQHATNCPSGGEIEEGSMDPNHRIEKSCN